MRAVIYVFSGTGNTLKVAELYKKYLGDVTIYRVTAQNGEEVPPPDGFDIVGVGYPIHAFVAPEPIREFCKSLPAVEGKPTFIFKSSGEGVHINDCSSQKIIKILQKKGYDVLCERHFVMPYNMIYRHCDEMAKQMWIYTQAMVDLHCRQLSAGGLKEKVKRRPVWRPFVDFVGFVERHFAHLHGGLFKVDAKKCVKCGKCVNACPEKNIRITEKGKYKFGHDCCLCMACSFGCPKDAVKVGLFKFWKVNGDYHVEKLAADPSLGFPYVPDKAKGIYRIYKKYYRECDKKLADGGISVSDYI